MTETLLAACQFIGTIGLIALSYELIGDRDR